MPVDPELLVFIKSVFLFSELTDEQLTVLLEAAQVVSLKRGEFLYKQGQVASDFFVIWAGKILLTTGKNKTMRNTGILIFGDYLGEDFLVGPRRGSNAMALGDTQVVKFPRKVVQALSKEAPLTKPYITLTAKARRMMRGRRFQWLNEEEVVYLIVRKHPYFLATHLILPLIFVLVGLGVLIPNLISGDTVWRLVGIVISLPALLWFLFVFLDWENDFYIVTSQRVIWVEKIILMYDSLQEAPLHTILSMKKVLHPVLAAFFDYGYVFVNTFTGNIELRRAHHPDLIMGFVDGLKKRAQFISHRLADQAMETAIRHRLGFKDPSLEGKAAPPPASSVTHTRKRKSALARFGNFFKMRSEEDGQITYRKHWIILLKKAGIPGIVNLILLLIGGFFWRTTALGILVCLPWFLIQLGTGIWFLYHLVDWHNDIYVLTMDSIMDIEKKPLTREEKRVANLDNILSLKHARKGIIGMLLNYGTVEINVGTETFTFDWVLNPVQVQYEITDRMNARRRKKEEEEAARERERVANWFAIYHRQTDELGNLEKTSEEGDLP